MISFKSKAGANGVQSPAAIDKDMMPRPLATINAFNYRAGIPDRYPTKTFDALPSAGIPFI
jgi:hypothetical protein